MSSIRSEDVQRLQAALSRWTGASASFNTYRDDHDYLVLRVQPSESHSDQDFGLRFFYCTYLAGPTSWRPLQLLVSQKEYPDGQIGFEVRDNEAGFVVHCHGPIDFGGDPKQVFRAHEPPDA
jgi:hypothetical protein